MHMTRGVRLAVGLGVGVGLMLSGGLVAFMPKPVPSDAEIRTRARALNMVDLTEMPQSQPKPQVVEKQVYFFTVAEGMTSYDVGAMFEQAGLVSDGQAFVDRATELGLEGAIKAGVYKVPLDDANAAPGLDQLIQLLTNSQ